MKKKILLQALSLGLLVLPIASCSSSNAPKQYTITFDTQGGSIVENQIIEEDNTVTKPNDPNKKDYIFAFWYKEKECINMYDFSLPVKTDFTLYARWLNNLEDADFDGLVNEIDKYPLDNNYSGTFSYTPNEFLTKIDISFYLDYREFVDINPETFNNNFARLGTILSGNTFGDIATKLNEAVYIDEKTQNTLLLEQFGCIDIKNISTDEVVYEEDKDDVHKVVCGHHPFTYKGIKQDVMFILFSPTDGNAQMASNLDVGADSDSYRSISGSNHLEWEDKNIHKGLDVTVNRLKPLIMDYVETKTSSPNPILFIAGYSRGAGLANVFAKKIDDLKTFKVFSYNHACLATTSESEEITKSYKNIFNIINTDDLVTELPWGKIGFRRYGIDINDSIMDNHFKEYLKRANIESYSKIASGWKTNIDLLGKDRVEFYEKSDEHLTQHGPYSTIEEANESKTLCESIMSKYGINRYFNMKEIIIKDGEYYVQFNNCPASLIGFIGNIMNGSVPLEDIEKDLQTIAVLFKSYIPFLSNVIAAILPISSVKKKVFCPHLSTGYYLLSEYAKI